ncbi:MAG: hypothetical protein ACR2M0_08930 [Chloroflexia bacterium]
MSRLTPFGTLLLLIFFLVVIGGALSATDNLHWPPRGFPTSVPAVTPSPTSQPVAQAPPTATTVQVAARQTVSAPAPAATRSAPPTPTLTATPTAVPANTPTATPQPGLAYVGPIDIDGAISGNGGPQPGATDPDSGRLYVAEADAAGRGVLGVYDGATGQKKQDVPLDLADMAMGSLAPVPVLVYTPTKRIYIVGRRGRIATVDTETLQPGPSYDIAQPIERAFLSPDGTKIYGLQGDSPGGSGALLRSLDVRTYAIRVLHVPTRWAADGAFADGSTLYLTGRDGLLPFDMVSGNFGAPISLGFEPLFPVFDPVGRRLYAWRQPLTLPLTPQLVVYNAADWTEQLEATLPGCPCPLAAGAAGKRLYLAMPTSPGHVLAYSQPGPLSTYDEIVLRPAPALRLLTSATNNRLYVQTNGPHALLVLADNGPAPGRPPVTVDVSR